MEAGICHTNILLNIKFKACKQRDKDVFVIMNMETFPSKWPSGVHDALKENCHTHHSLSGHLEEVTDRISDIQGLHAMYWWDKDTQHTLSGIDESQIDCFPLTRPCCTGQSVRLITLKWNWITESSSLKSHTPVLKSSDLQCFHSLLALCSVWKQEGNCCRLFSVDSFFSFFSLARV